MRLVALSLPCLSLILAGCSTSYTAPKAAPPTPAPTPTPTAATPTFSVGTGTYASAQTVTISESRRSCLHRARGLLGIPTLDTQQLLVAKWRSLEESALIPTNMRIPGTELSCTQLEVEIRTEAVLEKSLGDSLYRLNMGVSSYGTMSSDPSQTEETGKWLSNAYRLLGHLLGAC